METGSGATGIWRNAGFESTAWKSEAMTPGSSFCRLRKVQALLPPRAAAQSPRPEGGSSDPAAALLAACRNISCIPASLANVRIFVMPAAGGGMKTRPSHETLAAPMISWSGDGIPAHPSPTRPHERPRNIDDVVTAGGWVFPVPGDTEPDLEIDAPHLLQLEAAVRQILRPFGHEADAKTG